MRILMVCLGNICRSPLAEGILQSKLPADVFSVESAGTSAFHLGERPDIRSIKTARKNGLDISHQRSRPFVKEDFELYDHIFAMDVSNLSKLLEMAVSENQKNKVSLILDHLYPGQNAEVPDPYFGGDQGFDEVYDMLDRACTAIAKNLLKP